MNGVAVDAADGILTLTLDNPATLNAMTPTMRAGIIAALDDADGDDEVRAIIVTGAGRGFCSGADLSAGTTSFTPGGSGSGAYRDGGGTLTRRLIASRKPIIAAVNGPAVGIGAAMTLAMDFRIAAQGARFGFVYTRLGIGPEGLSSWLLPEVVGLPRAVDWMLTGRMIDADEALRAGLVRDVVPEDGLADAARALALGLIENTAPLAVAVTRRLLWGQRAETAARSAHLLESRMVPWLSATPDAAEGVAARRERRRPVFTGSLSGLGEDFPWPGIDPLGAGR